MKNKPLVEKNSYINAFQEGDNLVIIERDDDGKRVVKNIPMEYKYYTLDPYGQHRTIFGEACKEHVVFSRQALRQTIASTNNKSIYEADVNQVFRYLSANYDFDATPKLNVSILDIEVEYREDTRYSNPDKAENRIISYSIIHQWTNRIYCVVLVPDNKTIKETEAICNVVASKFDNANVMVAKTEAELLNLLTLLLEDTDVFTGWNSESYDFKYIVNRMKKVLGEDGIRRLSPLRGLPRERETFNEKIKSFESIYEPHGLVHLDYINLYKKYTYSELTSYSLDNVAYIELKDQKVEYDGNLYDLYLHDLETFLIYNIKDTQLVDRLDKKLKFIDLTNLLAHNNGVLMQTTLGTVALTEQAIINEGHYYFPEPVIFPNKPIRDEDATGAAGAFVVDPKKGVSREVSGIDVESLYPSIIRMFNMSPETLVAHINSDRTNNHISQLVDSGKVESFAEAWHPYFNTLEFDEFANQTDAMLTLEFNRSNKSATFTAKELREFIFSNDNLCITANGTVFDRTKIGVIPSLLTRWFNERRVLKGHMKTWSNKLELASTPEEKAECEYWVSYYNQRQMAKKINLNALYGALLNKNCRFYDKRIGQSTTLSGRSVTRHMGSQVNKLVIGEYTVNGGAVIYGDTDSIYFSVYEAMKSKGNAAMFDNMSKEEIITLYDDICNSVNASFPEFLNGRFNVGLERGAYISAARENLADYALFIKKKRYAMRIYDDDGKRRDVNGKKGKMKYMGIEVKRSDTPKIVQEVLIDGLEALLDGQDINTVMDIFVDFKRKIIDMEPWKLGRPCGANAVSFYTEKFYEYLDGKSTKKPTIPGAIAGAIHFNELLESNGEEHMPRITNGAKVFNCKLKKNRSGFTSVSIPTDLTQYPEWIKTLPYDVETTVDTLFIKKVDNIFGVVGLDIKYLSAPVRMFDNVEETDF